MTKRVKNSVTEILAETCPDFLETFFDSVAARWQWVADRVANRITPEVAEAVARSFVTWQKSQETTREKHLRVLAIIRTAENAALAMEEAIADDNLGSVKAMEKFLFYARVQAEHRECAIVSLGGMARPEDAGGRWTTQRQPRLHLGAWLLAHGVPVSRARDILGLSGDGWHPPDQCAPDWNARFNAIALFEVLPDLEKRGAI